MNNRKGDWCLVNSGRQFWPLDARPDEIHIGDIAHALSHICRFGGHCDVFYSVAQHSVHVSNLVPPHLALQGLLHDACEAYIGDMVRPLKRFIPQFQEAENALWKVIAVRFGLPYELAPEIKVADNIALMTERRDVMAWTPHRWGIQEAPDAGMIFALKSEAAKELFLKRYQELCNP